ncbi:GYD domain-containing protein [Candidatus Neomarinimicrobiota bacterium]
MATFIMYGTYSEEAMEEISATRTKEAARIIEKEQGKVSAMYALLGAEDLLFIVEFPDIKRAMRASVALQRATGIAFSSTEAIPVAEFDALMSKD